MSRTFAARALVVLGALLALVNLAFLPSILQGHRGEVPVVAFHLGAVVLGLGLAWAGRRLGRGPGPDRGPG